jgi:uncharacterized protein (DUF488 family)
VKIVTIGVYGFDEAGFFAALREAGVDLFCDIRQRRGVRGSQYAFANSQRLQARLAAMGIGYLHNKELAPTPAVRARQDTADKASKTAKRQRTTLSSTFIEAYQSEILNQFDPQELIEALPPDTQVVALFCVEQDPAACHRSLVAAKLAEAKQLEVEHLLP